MSEKTIELSGNPDVFVILHKIAKLVEDEDWTDMMQNWRFDKISGKWIVKIMWS